MNRFSRARSNRVPVSTENSDRTHERRYPEFRGQNRQLFSMTDIARLCNVKLDTVSRWNRYHNLKVSRRGLVSRQNFIEFIRYSGHTEVLNWI